MEDKNKSIQVGMTQDDLLFIIGALIKNQVSKGVKEDKSLDLVARLSLQAIEKVDFNK